MSKIKPNRSNSLNFIKNSVEKVICELIHGKPFKQTSGGPWQPSLAGVLVWCAGGMSGSLERRAEDVLHNWKGSSGEDFLVAAPKQLHRGERNTSKHELRIFERFGLKILKSGERNKFEIRCECNECNASRFVWAPRSTLR